MASITDDVVPVTPKKGSLTGDVKRGVGNILTTVARAGQDVGVPLPSISAYGQQLVAANPSEISTAGDILANPGTTVREAVGENAPQIGLAAGAGKTGQVVGGLIGAGVGALTRNPANIARFEQIGQNIGGTAGFAAPTLAQEYGSIRQSQDETGVDDKGRALAAAGVATALEQAGESKVVKRLLRIPGGGEVAERAGGVVSDLAKQAGRTALTEGATEAAQTATERLGAGQSLTDQDAVNDIAISTAKGAAGGAAIGGATRGAEIALGRTEQAASTPPAEGGAKPGEEEPIPHPLTQTAAVVNPTAGPLSRAVTAGVDSGDVVGVDVVRGSVPMAAVAPPAPVEEAPPIPAPDAVPLASLDGTEEAPWRQPAGRLTPEANDALTSLYEAAHQGKPQFDDFLGTVASDIGGTVKTAELKGRARSEEKIDSDYNGDPGQIKDLLRGTIVAKDLAGAQQAIDRLGEGTEIVSAKNYLDPAVESPYGGYRDAKFTVRTPTGALAEIQINTPEMVAAKKAAHPFYVESRTIDADVQKQGGVATAEQMTRLGELRAAQAKVYEPAWAAVVAGARSAANASGEIASSAPGLVSNESGSGLGSAPAYDSNAPLPSANLTSATGVPSLSNSSEAAGGSIGNLGASVTAASPVNTASNVAQPVVRVQKDGSAIVEGDRRQLQAQLKAAGVPALPATTGVRVAAKHLEKARLALAPATAAETVGAAASTSEARAAVVANRAATAADPQTETPEFQSWFGQSKVADKDGTPIRVYHGSPVKGTTVFDPNIAPIRARTGPNGTYFTNDPATAASYSQARERDASGKRPWGGVTEAYLSLQNPLDITDDIKKGRKKGLSFGEAKRAALTKLTDEHDGVIFRGDSMNPAEYIAFRPEQIKSATANSGAFDATNPDIRASAAAAVPAKGALPAARVQGEIARLTKRWKDGPAVQVVQHFEDIPAEVRAQLNPKADAAYDGKGAIYVVGDRMKSGADVRRVLAHEAYAHYGVKGLLGAQFPTFLARVTALKDTDASIKRAADSVYQRYGELDPQVQADEIVAHMAENYASLTGQAKLLMARVIAAAKDFLRNRLGLNVQWSKADVLDMISRARTRIEKDEGAAPTPSPAEVRASVPNPTPQPSQSFDGWTFPSEKLADHLAQAAGNRVQAYKAAAAAKGDKLRGLFQDYFLPVKRVQRAIKDAGGNVSEDADVYGREELYYGRTGEQLRQLEEEKVKPLVRELVKQGISQSDLELYLYAKFAPVRNARIAEINAKMPDGGSGMTNADAARIISDFQASGQTAKLEELAKRVYELNDVRMKALEDGGLLSKEEADLWRQEDTYVPLKGLAEGVKDDTGTRLPVGGGFSVGGKEAWRALGRRSRATDILANAIAQTEQAIIRAEKNRVAQALLKLAQENPNAALWEVNAHTYKPHFDKATGEVKYDRALEPDAVIAKVGGKEYRINIRDQRLLEAVKNMGAAKVGSILRAFSSVNRFLSLTRTTLAPEFVLSNFARDLQTAAVNLGGERSTALAAKTVRDVPLAIKGVWGLRRGKLPAGEWGRWAREFAESGALTSFVSQRTVEEQQTKIESLLKEVQGGVVGSSRKVIRATMELVEDANSSVENGVRLSAYANARRDGLSVQEAARLAKNLTVNFNRKGSAGSAINAMYLFYNASIQGTHRFLTAMKSPKVQAAMASTALLGFGLGFYNRAIGGKDDDGEDKWDKIQDWEKERNLIVMKPDGSTIKIPMPYTYNLPFLLGSQMSDMVFGKKKASDGAANMVNALIDAFNPIGNVDFKQDITQQIAKLSTPTVTLPFLDIALNKNFFNGPIMPQGSPYDKTPDPDSERYFPSTNPTAVAFARELNRITGGNKVRPGAIDISPASMTYVFDYLTGGTGSFFDRVGTSVGLAAKGEDVPTNKIPFARVFAGSLSENRVSDTYYKTSQDVAEKFEMARLAVKPGGLGDASESDKQDMAFGRRLAGPMRTADNQLKKVSEAIKYARAQNDDDRVKELKERQRQIMLRFNTAYFRVREEFSQED